MKTLRKLTSTIALSLITCLLVLGVPPVGAQEPTQSQQQTELTVTPSEESNRVTQSQLVMSTETGPVELTEQQMERVQGRKVSYTYPASLQMYAFLKGWEIFYQRTTGRNASVKTNWRWFKPVSFTINFY